MVNIGILCSNSIKRRYIFEADFPFGKLEPTFVKVVVNPPIDETEVSQSESKYAHIDINYIDITEAETVNVYNILAKSYDLDNKLDCAIKDMYGTGKLTLYHWHNDLASNQGEYKPYKIWTLNKIWPTQVNFGEFGELMLNITWRYESSLCNMIND